MAQSAADCTHSNLCFRSRNYNHTRHSRSIYRWPTRTLFLSRNRQACNNYRALCKFSWFQDSSSRWNKLLSMGRNSTSRNLCLLLNLCFHGCRDDGVLVGTCRGLQLQILDEWLRTYLLQAREQIPPLRCRI